jgi:hypothetical protein
VTGRLVAWLLENGCIWLPVLVAIQVPPPLPHTLATSVVITASYLAAVATVIVEGVILLQHLLSSVVYSHVPRFRAGGAPPPLSVRYVSSPRQNYHDQNS